MRTTILIGFLSGMLTFTANAQVPGITVLSNNSPAPGYMFLATMHWDGSHPNYLLILDNSGNTIYSKTLPPGFDGNYTDFKPQPGNRYSFFSPVNGFYYIMDRFFTIIDSVRAGNGYETDNHELIITARDHYFLMGLENREIDMSELVAGGDPYASVTGIVVQELDSLKNVIFEWKTLDHLPITDSRGRDLTAATIDYIHSNSLFIDTDTTFIMSNRHLNELTKVSRTTGTILWRMGKNSNGNQFTFVNDSMGFSYQHHAVRLPNGNITLFDNGDFRANGIKISRACEYQIDEVTKTATLVWQYRSSQDHVANAMGSVQRLPNGNTFINWGTSYPNVTEVDGSGSKVFEMSFPISSTVYSYRAFKFDVENPLFAGFRNNASLLVNKINIYPNPAPGRFYVDPGNRGEAQVSVYNLMGELVLQKTISGAQQVFNLAAGVYNVVVAGADWRETQKLVVY